MGKRYTRTSGDAYASLGDAGATLRRIAFRLIHESGQLGMTALEVVDASGEERWSIQPRIAETLVRHAKSDLVSISGRLQLNRWADREGNDREQLQVIADTVMPAKAVRPAGGRRRDREERP